MGIQAQFPIACVIRFGSLSRQRPELIKHRCFWSSYCLILEIPLARLQDLLDFAARARPRLELYCASSFGRGTAWFSNGDKGHISALACLVQTSEQDLESCKTPASTSSSPQAPLLLYKLTRGLTQSSYH